MAALSRLDATDDPETAAVVLAAWDFLQFRLKILECQTVDYRPPEGGWAILNKTVDFLNRTTQPIPYREWNIQEKPDGSPEIGLASYPWNHPLYYFWLPKQPPTPSGQAPTAPPPR